MVENQIKCSKLEQRSLIKFYVVEKFKPYGIYARIFNIYREAGFGRKSVYKLAEYAFALTSLSGKNLSHK